MSLTLDEVRQIRFRMTRRGEVGYQVGDVDTFIDKVELTFDEFEKERERLRREVESAGAAAVPQDAPAESGASDAALQEKDAEIERLRDEVRRLTESLDQGDAASAAQAAAESRIGELTAQNEQLSNKLEQVRGDYDKLRAEQVTSVAGGTEHLVVTASEDAAPAVTRLLQMATDQSTTLVNEAQAEAQRKIAEAEQRASEIKTDARTKAERVESEARVNAEQVMGEARSRAAAVDQQADDRRRELFSALEREQGELTVKVDALRGFESSYRQNLGGTLQHLLSSLNDARPEPADVPELAQRESETPRLDALANGEQS
ncbi:MAG TPA: DivIVA domain-containing protein [Arachnia sp.]|jgi:DivIVA domain-containing protein|nr:DivIVA domain-containing protein [Propionibacteriaceae bacterium]HOA27290.1 DivIVA domain-containing protein [Arachnia sp.]HQD21667.1 DivIVA domain-containing protein [Arachnia sp.]